MAKVSKKNSGIYDNLDHQEIENGNANTNTNAMANINENEYTSFMEDANDNNAEHAPTRPNDLSLIDIDEAEYSDLTCRQKMKRILRSHRFHMILIGLVVLESMFVAGEVIITDIEAMTLKHDQSGHTKLDCSQQMLNLNYTQSSSLNHSLSNQKNHDHRARREIIENLKNYSSQVVEKIVDSKENNNPMLSNLKEDAKEAYHKIKAHETKHGTIFEAFHILEKICKFGSLFILVLFIIEIFVKLIFDPKSFLKVLEILDVLVIIVSFGLNVFLLVKDLQVHAVTGLLTLLRLWRIAEIIQAVAITIEAKYVIKFRKMEKKMKMLEKEYGALKI